ncbi:MAG TPA: DNA mismatch repair endonuclease MutL [Anaerolineales bacterium]|nr:DNA mismatch repair endonuclease MutL [Anaerolineales bacterium]
MALRTPIQVLPPEVAERIAAGEVVERPASVVKELIENSLDAGASAVSVEIRDGGLSLVRVSDDGCGISRADLPLALERFATSKIHTLEDLEAVHTLGFRGEALSSIAAVAHLEILTRTQGELEGSRLRVEGGRVVVEPAASPVGTSVTVRRLFYNTPARRKFLKSPMREGELVRQTVVRYSLAYPAVAFRLVVNGRETYVAPPATPLERVGAALGREVAAEMVPIGWEAADLRIEGYVSRPTLGRRDRKGQFFFINGRPVRSGLLAVMLERPYAGRLPPDRRPLAVVHIRIDPRLVDVNVHPRKVEVRLSQERSVYGALTRAVEETLSPYPRREEAYPALMWPFAEVEAGVVREERAEYVAARLESMGQLNNAYIVARGPEGLVVVDQHAAHEQVLFERLLGGGGTAQPVSPPVRVELTPREAERLEPFLALLADLGTEVEPFGRSTFLIRTLPAPVASSDPRELLEAVLGELPGCRRLEPEAARERLAMKIACTAAVKAGDILSDEEMQALLDDLTAAWSPATCPHGRPAFVLLTVEELERRFMRR